MANSSWGSGWPNCQTNRLKTVVLSNGIKLPVRAEIAELVGLLCEETMRRGYALVPGWCWGFACRPIGGTRTPSNHSWGLAVDLNAPKNPYGNRLITDMPAWMPELWKSYGFRWGGDYSRKKDAMHYEFMGSVADAKRQTERARQALGGSAPGIKAKGGDDVIRIIKTTNEDGSEADGVFVEANGSTVKWVPNDMIWGWLAKHAAAGGGKDGPVLVRRDEFDTLERIGNAPASVWPK